jgi:hypothetical protein
VIRQKSWPGLYSGKVINDRWQVFELQMPTRGRYAVFDDTIGELVRDKRNEFVSFNTVKEAETWIKGRNK